jgi:hypothetical protein
MGDPGHHAGRPRRGLVSKIEILATAIRRYREALYKFGDCCISSRAFSPILGKTMLRTNTNASRHAGQPLVRRGRALACAAGSCLAKALISQSEPAA